MGDLISRAATLERMKSMAGCATCNNYNGVRCRACIWDDALNIVDELPAVDAVPVEWLREKMREPQMTTGNPFGFVLAEWLDEQEAR